jgi:AcrR family transcriptional regulator
MYTYPSSEVAAGPQCHAVANHSQKPPTRGTYRHGDLRRALVEAGVALARESGPKAVTLREATRRAGVVPNAAYRHFANHGELVDAVRDAALAAAAVSMEKRLRALGPDREDLDYARASLRAVGAGYLHFARTQTGLFKTAFVSPFDRQRGSSPARAGKSGLNPFQLLSGALDRIVRSGGMPAANRVGAEYLAWSAVHGMAMLMIDGPLRRIRAAEFDALAARLLEMVEKGIR